MVRSKASKVGRVGLGRAGLGQAGLGRVRWSRVTLAVNPLGGGVHPTSTSEQRGGERSKNDPRWTRCAPGAPRALVPLCSLPLPSGYRARGLAFDGAGALLVLDDVGINWYRVAAKPELKGNLYAATIVEVKTCPDPTENGKFAFTIITKTKKNKE